MNKANFLQHYINNIEHKILKFEKQREDLSFSYLSLIFISILFGVIFFFVVAQLATAISTTTSVSAKSPLFGVFIASIVYLVVTLYFLFMLESASKDIESFLMELKVRYLNRILSYFGNLCWSVDTSIPKLNTEKLVGEYKNIPFKILETKNDIFLTFKSNKYFKNETLVKSKKRFNFKCSYEIVSFICSTLIVIIVVAILINYNQKSGDILKEYLLDSIKILFPAIAAGIYSISSFISSYLKYKKTKIEDIEFTRDFVVYTEDEISARYFLTPSFIERFKNIQTAFGRKNISCSCKNQEICFKIAKPKNLFEVCNIFKPLKNHSAIRDLYDEIIAIYKMIDYFKLSENTKI